MDAIEITMGRPAHERLVDLELSKTDLTEIPLKMRGGLLSKACGLALRSRMNCSR